MEYAWNFELETTDSPLEATVTTVYWRLIGVKEDISSSVYGSVSLEEPVPSTFVEFEDLTEQVVKSWCLDNMEQTEDELKEKLKTEVDSQINPVSVMRQVPWANQ
jgi:hypothetical protein